MPFLICQRNQEAESPPNATPTRQLSFVLSELDHRRPRPDVLGEETDSANSIHNCTTKKKIIWYTVCLLSLSGCIVQCTDRIHQYIYKPTTVNVKHRDNNTVTLPSITLCPADILSRHPAVWKALLKKEGINASYETTFDLLKVTNMSVDTLWDMSRILVDNITYISTHYGGVPYARSSDIHNIEMRDIATVLGTCREFTPLEDSLPYKGATTGIHIQAFGNVPENTIEGIPAEAKIILHSADKTPLIKLHALGSGAFVPYGAHMDHTVRLQEIIHYNTWQNPCETEEIVVNCTVECIEQHVFANSTAKCRLPYMTKRENLPNCSTPEDFQEIYSATERIFENHCNCHRSCRHIEYTTELIFRYPGSPNGLLFSIFVSFPSNQIEITEEELNYGLTCLFSDIGGAMGLFLGISILTIFETVHHFFLRVVKK